MFGLIGRGDQVAEPEGGGRHHGWGCLIVVDMGCRPFLEMVRPIGGADGGRVTCPGRGLGPADVVVTMKRTDTTGVGGLKGFA
jgi:hypothetical protein